MHRYTLKGVLYRVPGIKHRFTDTKYNLRLTHRVATLYHRAVKTYTVLHENAPLAGKPLGAFSRSAPIIHRGAVYIKLQQCSRFMPLYHLCLCDFLPHAFFTEKVLERLLLRIYVGVGVITQNSRGRPWQYSRRGIHIASRPT